VLDDMTGWVEDIIDALGYAGVAFLVALENLFPPIPSEVVLPLAGFVAGRGEASIIGMIAAATVGSTVGALILYGIAAWIGPVRIHDFIVRYGRWFTIKDADLVRAEEWFDRRSDIAVLAGRCVPIIRSIVSVPAGFRRMPIVRFTILTILGSLVWNSALVGAGAALGENWEKVGDWVGLFQIVVIVVIVGLILWFVFARFVKPRLAARGALPADMDEIDADGDGFADR
jgi:membrane protein DedA with SNARE-associated domain